ncbi:acyl carrier protein [Bacteriovoracales bacterium]|nr:acyl carrier protein [Bacteriovoracales bacterium]
MEREELKKIFTDVLGIDKNTNVEDLLYAENDKWDSVAHMALVAKIEDHFDIMIDTEDIIDMSSFHKSIEIISKYDERS